jgi:hypothetical protein
MEGRAGGGIPGRIALANEVNPTVAGGHHYRRNSRFVVGQHRQAN